MIRHTALFKLEHAHGSAKETEFLREGLKLADLPMVRNFECLRQVSDKNHDHGTQVVLSRTAGPWWGP